MSTNYEKFIVANQSLIECYASVPAEQYSAMSNSEQQQVCKSEANTVAQFLKQGQVDFKAILAERIAAFDAPKEWS